MEHLSNPPKVQFMAVRPQITELLEKGYSFSQAYRELIDKKMISMSYSTFVRYVTGRNQKIKNTNADNTMAVTKIQRVETKIISSESLPFGKKDFDSSENI